MFNNPEREVPLFGPEYIVRRDSIIIFKAPTKKATIEGISDLDATPFVFASKKGLNFGVGLHWSNPRGEALTMEVDKGATDYLTSWRAMQILSNCDMMGYDFCEAALDLLNGEEWGSRDIHQMRNVHNQAVASGRDLTHLERLSLGLGGIKSAEQICREITNSVPSAEEAALAEQILTEHKVREGLNELINVNYQGFIFIGRYNGEIYSFENGQTYVYEKGHGKEPIHPSAIPLENFPDYAPNSPLLPALASIIRDAQNKILLDNPK